MPGLVARTSHGTGFRAPTFNDLYYPGFGNPNLQPETSESYEVGLRWQPLDDTVLDVAIYRTELYGAFDPLASGVVNIDRARIDGVEASLSHRFDQRWHGRAAVELRDPRDLRTGLYLRRQERFKASAELGFRATEDLDLSARLTYVDERDDEEFGIGRVSLPSYFTVDVAAIYRLDELSRLKVAVENLFDEEYSTAYGYRSPGRTISLDLSRTF
jgi:vitamin B12 transporter